VLDSKRNSQSTVPLKSNFYIRLISLIGIVILGMLVGNGLLLVISASQGWSIGSESDLYALLNDENNQLLVKFIVGINQFSIFILSPLIFLYVFERGYFQRYLSLYNFLPRLLLLFPIALFMLYPAMGYITTLMDRVDWPEWMGTMDEESMASLSQLLKMETVSDLMLNMVIIALLPAIGEELLFRGVLQKEIFLKTNNGHLAIWTTAIIFGIFHFQISGLLPKIMIGALLGYAYWWSQSLILSMILHGINNGVLTIAHFYTQNQVTDDINIENPELPILSVVLSSALFCFIIYEIYRITRPGDPVSIEHDQNPPNNE